ncbi:MAG: ABC transporter substrate-binding protein [Gemmatimonadaceae bacterium]|nr:ABC transporter substrate-binding protein [Gemmatimonadaceae bacterium]
MRVVSLLPAATEMVAALGAFESLVGVTHECDFPPPVTSRMRVTHATLDAHAPSAAIDAAVRAATAEGTPLFSLDAEGIRALHPDLIITQAVCDVCAVAEADVRALAAQLSPSPPVLSLGATTLDGILGEIAAVARAIGHDDEGAELVVGLRARMRAVHERLKAARAPRPRVAVIEWTDPLYAAGHWTPDVIRRAGGVDVLATAGAHSVPVSTDAIIAAAPDVVIVAPCGFDLARASREAEALAGAPWCAGRPVWAIDANAFLSRPGPRVVDAVEIVARILHPSLFTPLTEGLARRVA